MTGELSALVLEDQPTWQSILTEILNDLGFQTDVCSTLPDACKLITRSSHRIAIVDLSLDMSDPNDQSGLAALDYLRQHDPSCQAILLSGYATVRVAVSALKELGAFTCLQKENFKREEFVKQIHQALNLPPRVGIRHPVSERPTSSAEELIRPSNLGELSVLVVEDDAGWRSVLTELVEDAGYSVDVCSSYGEGVIAIRKKTYDLVILDLVLGERMMPGQRTGGTTLLEQIDQSNSEVIILSGEVSPGEINRLVSQYPIAAFIEKGTFQRGTVLEKIQEILAKQPNESGNFANLTPREQELLGLIAKGYTNLQIADQMMITINTVKRHTKAVFRKMGIHNRSAAAAMFRGKVAINKGG